MGYTQQGGLRDHMPQALSWAQKEESMKSMRVLFATAVALIVVLGGLSVPARGEPAGNAVTE